MKRYNKLIIIFLLFSFLTTLLVFNASAASIAYGAGTVSASALNVRPEPNTTSPVSARIYKDNIVVILDIPNDTWYHINCNGTIGYVAAMYITDVVKAENFNAVGSLTGSDIRLRSEPSTAGNILGTYSDGTVMSVIGINNGWYKVEYAGNTGYIRSDFINIINSGSVSSAGQLSAVLGESSSSDLGQEIAVYAHQFIGYSYIYGAASPTVGFDCSGLTYYVYGKFGYTISRTASAQFRNNGISVSKANLQPGDLVFFSSNGGRSITHVGLYYGDNKFVNASTGAVGVIFSSLDSAYYTRVYYGAKRIVS